MMTDVRKRVDQRASKQQRDNERASVISVPIDSWGWFPQLCLLEALGLFVIALAYESGRLAMQWTMPLYWVGLLTLFLPIGGRLITVIPARRERIALLVLLGVALYLTKFLQYPLYFANNDEFLHLRAINDIVASNHLFQANPLLSISSFFPGLEIVTHALISLTGLPAYPMGILVIGVVRLSFMLTLYLFYERVSGTARVASIATLLYVTNSDFLLGNAIFAYESIALPLAVFVVLVLALRSHRVPNTYQGLTITMTLSIGAVVITHHLTSYALIAFLLLWTILSFLQKQYQKDWLNPAQGVLFGVLLCITWLIYTKGIVVDYLSPRITETFSQLSQMLTHRMAPRQLFQDGSGSSNPIWERIVSTSSVGLISLGAPIGAIYVWRRRMNAIALALTLSALMYPVSQGLRVVNAAGAEVADRSSAFLFLGVAFVLALGLARLCLSHSYSWARSLFFIVALATVVIGQVIAGSGPPWIRAPGPYLLIADSRSIEPEGITAAQWADAYLGPDHRIATDHVNTALMATYGDEQVVTQWTASDAVDPIFTAPQLSSDVLLLLRQDNVEYLVVDRRLSTGLPRMGFYFEDPASGEILTTPISLAALTKFDTVENVSRVFDSGNIVIYNMDALIRFNGG